MLKIHDVFYIPLLEQDNKKNRLIDEIFQPELDTGNNDKLKIEVICDSKFYTKVSDYDHLSGPYYLVLQKGHLEKQNTKELVLAI